METFMSHFIVVFILQKVITVLLFFVARYNQKIRILARGPRSIRVNTVILLTLKSKSFAIELQMLASPFSLPLPALPLPVPPLSRSTIRRSPTEQALIAQLGERQTEAIRSYPISGVI
jgi:hypothetical protein